MSNRIKRYIYGASLATLIGLVGCQVPFMTNQPRVIVQYGTIQPLASADLAISFDLRALLKDGRYRLKTIGAPTAPGVTKIIARVTGPNIADPNGIVQEINLVDCPDGIAIINFTGLPPGPVHVVINAVDDNGVISSWGASDAVIAGGTTADVAVTCSGDTGNLHVTFNCSLICGGGSPTPTPSPSGGSVAMDPDACVPGPAYSPTPIPGSQNVTSVATVPGGGNPTAVAVAPNGDLYFSSGTSGIYKLSGGIVTTVSTSFAQDMEFDAAGNLFFTNDYDAVKKIDTSGTETTIANVPTPYVYGIAIEPSTGDLYVGANSGIKKVTQAGVVTDFAGSDSLGGWVDGTGTSARFGRAYGLAFDHSGNLIVSDSLLSRIRMVTPAGVVTTIAGSCYDYVDGTGAGGMFRHSHGIAVDSNDDILVADYDNDRIRKVTHAGVVTTIAGSGVDAETDGTANTADIYRPSDVAINLTTGQIYIADNWGSKVRLLQ